MSKADYALTTPAPFLNRRDLLAAGAATIAGAAVPVPAAAAGWSPEFLAYLRSHANVLAAVAAPVGPFGTPACTAQEAAVDAAVGAWSDAVGVLGARTPRNWDDVTELAFAVQQWMGGLGEHPFHTALQDAVLKVGGAQFLR